ncbi:DUF551 domain-containing protein [Acinetobacter indicus]|uniref:DUF551 domain-containing protein n=1 Tax=Acinetobacter indicus TaxID=756892 RepID=UPI002576FF1F|nr:DUF551 domain-containing protein [Acinetobacter indicus]MDM1279066.1 DUF551 domain-containing protein [Acinetobacter indicus]
MDLQKEREAFEEKFNHLDLSFVDDLGYCEIETQTAWEAWQAAKAQADQKIKLLLCDEHLKKCESPTGIFNSQYPDEEPCLVCLTKEAKAQAVPGWISVKNSLPPENTLVLGMSQTPCNIFNTHSVMALDEFEEADVTHWMPLPDAPQEPAND